MKNNVRRICFCLFVLAMIAGMVAVATLLASAGMSLLHMDEASILARASLRVLLMAWPVGLVTLLVAKLTQEENVDCY